MPSRLTQSTSPRLADILVPEANSFGVLRFAMATLVLISHSYLYAAGTSDAEPLQLWLGRSLGEYAVQVFFILSGLMVAQSFDRSRSVLDFAVGRALRIFPALFVCVISTAFVLGPLVSRLPYDAYFANRDLYQYIAKTLSLSSGSASLPGVFESVPFAGYVNSSLWTLKYEVLCYAGLALAGAAGFFHERLRFASTVGIMIVIVLSSASLPNCIEDYGFRANLRYFAVFFGTGVVAYLMRQHLRINGLVALALIPVFALSFAWPGTEVGAALFLGYGALWAAAKSWGPMREFCNKFDASFGIYIFAGPVQQTLLWFFPGLSPLWLSLLAFSIVFPLALMSWTLIEKPALRLRPKAVALFGGRLNPTLR